MLQRRFVLITDLFIRKRIIESFIIKERNKSIYNEETKEILKYWKKFKNVHKIIAYDLKRLKKLITYQYLDFKQNYLYELSLS